MRTITSKKIAKTLSLIAAVTLLSNCEFTKKEVTRAIDAASAQSGNNGNGGNNQNGNNGGNNQNGNGGNGNGITPIVVTSHTNNQEVNNGDLTLTGSCKNNGEPVIITGNVASSPVSTACTAGKFSQLVQLTNFNVANNISITQKQNGATQSQALALQLFAQAPFCGNGVVDQAWEACDGGGSCDEFCQTGGVLTFNDLILVRVNVDAVINQGSGNISNRIYVGNDTHSIPQKTWFPLFFNGSFIVDGQTTGYDSAPGVIFRRLGNQVKVLMKTSLSNSDLEHIRGQVEFFNATAIAVSSGLNSEVVEQPSDGEIRIEAGQDEIFLESGRSHFWFTENTADDAYFTTWN